MGYTWDFQVVIDGLPVLLRGLVLTVELWAAALALGLALGFVVGLGRVSGRGWLNGPAIAYVELFRNTPVLVQLIWFYYAFPVIVGLDIPAHVAAGMTLSLYTGAFYAEIIRGGVNSIERGQWDAARAIGMRRGQVMRRVILPQAIKRMIPPFMNQSITQLKNTSLVSTIAVSDLLYQGEIITATTYRPLEVYTVVAIIYFGVLFPLTLLAQLVEKRLAASD